MGNSSSLMLQDDEIAEISKETECGIFKTYFDLVRLKNVFLVNRNQIVRLYSRFLSLDKKGEILK